MILRSVCHSILTTPISTITDPNAEPTLPGSRTDLSFSLFSLVVPQGVKLIKQHHAHLNPLYVFISPPSMSSLRTRLTGRGTESDESLSARLAAAVGELEYAQQPGAFDVVVVNDQLDRAYGVLKDVIIDGKTDGGDRLPDFTD